MAKIELTRRRILGGLVTIGAGSAAAGAGTFALFSDSDTESADGLAAGTFNLEVGTENTLSFSKTNIAPTQTDSTSVDLEQTGTATVSDAALSRIKVTGVSSDENGNEEAEPTDSDDDGELKDQVGLDIKITDADETTYYLEEGGTISTSSSAGYETATKYEGDEWGDSTASNDVINPFSGPATFTIDAKFFDETNNNAAQGDSLKVDFKFVLEQR